MKRMTTIILAAALAAALTTGCAGGPEMLSVPRLGTRSGPRFTLNLEPGFHYAKDAQFLWYKYTVRPQVAAWLEKPDGTFIDTIYVTEIGMTGKYAAAPKHGRPEALPVWSHLRKEGADAVSSPTTVGTRLVYGNDIAARLPDGIYIIKLETNRSYDWNEMYSKKNSGVNGQPSIVYLAELAIGGEDTEADFVPVGTGSVDGSSGGIRPGLDGLDTALALFTTMKVSYQTE